MSEVAAGGTIIRKDPNADEKIKEDRARRERLKQPRPEEVYAALERKDVLDMSDLNHLAQLHVVAGIVGLRQLSQDAMSQIFLVTSKGVKAKDLVPVLWFLCFEKNGDVAELKGWVWQKLRLENMCGDLTYCLDFRAKLADSDFWIYMFDLVRGILLEKGVTGIEEFIRFFWTRGSPR